MISADAVVYKHRSSVGSRLGERASETVVEGGERGGNNDDLV